MTNPDDPLDDGATKVIEPMQASLETQTIAPVAPKPPGPTPARHAGGTHTRTAPHVVTFRAGEVLASPNDAIAEIAVVMEGEVAVIDPRSSSDLGSDAKIVALTMLRSGMALGSSALAVSGLNDIRPRHAFKIVASTDGKLLRIPSREFIPLLVRFSEDQKNPHAARWLISAVARPHADALVLLRQAIDTIDERDRAITKLEEKLRKAEEKLTKAEDCPDPLDTLVEYEQSGVIDQVARDRAIARSILDFVQSSFGIIVKPT